MLNRRIYSLAAALVLSAAPLCAQDQAEAVSPDTVMATVNGTDITAGHLILMRGQLPPQFQQYPDAILLDGLLTQAIQEVLLSQQTEELSTIAKLALQNEERSLKAAEEIERLSEAAVTDEALQAAYDAEFADAEPTQEFHAAHILVETEEEAAALVEELTGGADFAALAREHSTGPTGPNGGDLGWFGMGAMVPEFEAAVVELEPGAVSAPVQTQFGWHVIQLNETRMQDVPTLDEVRDQIVQQVQRAAVEDHLGELEGEADVTRVDVEGMDASFLSDPTLLQ